MVLIELPPQTSPRLLTAHKRIESLGEHAVAFMNANNKKSWAEYEPEALDNLATFLGEMLSKKEQTVEELKRVNFRVRTEISKGLGMNRTYDLLGRLYGYAGWREAKIFADAHEGRVINRNFGSTVNKIAEVFASQPAQEKGLIKRLAKIPQPVNYLTMRTKLGKGASKHMFDTLKKKMQLAAVMIYGDDLPEHWKERDLNYMLVPDPDDPLKFWILTEKHWSCLIPFRADYQTVAISVTLYPVSKAYKSTGEPTYTEKTFAQWRSEYIQKHGIHKKEM